MALTHVLTPIRIADVNIRNRVMRTAHGTLLGQGMVNDDLIAYHVARGRGGVGLSIIETLAVHWSTAGPTINIFVPGVEEGYRRLVAAVRPTGMKLFQQLWHAGHNTLPFDGSPPWSSSDLPGRYVGIPAIPMTRAMIDEVVGAFADAACKMAAWGIDGVEIHAGHGYLVSQFLSPAWNTRTDEYGGSFGNRIRFLHEVVTAVRNAVPKGYPVGVRVAPELLPGGLDADAIREVVHYLEERALIDYVNVSIAGAHMIHKNVAGMYEPPGYQMPTSTPVTRGVKLPTMVTGRFRTLEEADQVIRAGDASMVSFVRALIADPEIINKTVAGHPEQVRPCIACNQGCLARVFDHPYRVGCAINPGAGFERTLGDDKLAKAASPRRILVVGGGPAGMEAARVAALRGHRVTLAEASASLGGAILAAAKAPTRHGLMDFTGWLEAEIYRLGVEIRLSTYVEAEDVMAEPWDAVIIATGSTPRLDGVQSSNPGDCVQAMDQPHVISSNDLMLGGRPDPGRSAVVVDDNGHYEALAVAEHLTAKGVEVNFVTRHVSVAPKVEWAQMVGPALARMAGARFTAHLRTRLLAVGRNTVSVGPIDLPPSPGHAVTLAADTVVFVSANRSNRDLYCALTGRVPDLRIVGDANSARALPDAVREGHLAGAAL